MKLLLVDDHALFTESLRSLLTANGFEVLDVASDGLEALALARKLRPDLILMDIEMPRCDGLQATRLIKAEMPAIRIVMLTELADDDCLFEAIKSGAFGYLLKSLTGERFIGLLRQAEAGEAVLCPGMTARVLAEFARQGRISDQTSASPSEEMTDLTPRQVEILTLVASGMTYHEVGETLHLSDRTISYHMREIIERLHLENRAQVIAMAAHMGLVLPGRAAPNE